MVFAKSAFSIMVHKIFDLGSIFGGQNSEISMKNRLQKHAVFQHWFLSVLFGFCSHFGIQNLVKNLYFSKKKTRFEGVLWSSSASKWFFGGLLKRLGLNFGRLSSLQYLFFGSRKPLNLEKDPWSIAGRRTYFDD